MRQHTRDDVVLLDVGGGAGMIANAVADHIDKTYGKKVCVFALDLSPGMLEIQRQTNPKLARTLNEDVRHTSLKDREIDLALMIDVIEHVPEPTKAMREINRFSSYCIYKVPLENNLLYRLKDFFAHGRLRKSLIETYGHINVYNASLLKAQILKTRGEIIDFSYSNASEYFRSQKNLSFPSRLRNWVAAGLFRISPSLAARVFLDFAMVLVRGESSK